MLVVKAVSRGVVVSLVAVVLYLVVAVLVPITMGLFESSMAGGGGGGMVGFSVSIELALVVAIVGFFAGLGWTLLQRWAR